MTLATYVLVHDPIDPEALFAEANRLIGATDPETFRDDGAIRNRPGQGYPALVWIDRNIDGTPVRSAEQVCSGHTDPEELWGCGKSHLPEHHLSLSFDTGYGYRVEKNGRTIGCTELHALYIFELADYFAKLDPAPRWGWINEYTGEYREGTEGLGEFIGNGENAMDWFNNIAKPAIKRMLGA